MPTIRDERTPEERASLTLLIVGTDSFMSGWGAASGGASYAAWAIDPRDPDVDRVLRAVAGRTDMRRVRVVSDRPASPYRPGRGCSHLTIYPVTPEHPARSGSFR